MRSPELPKGATASGRTFEFLVVFTGIVMIVMLAAIGASTASAEDFYLRTQEDCGYNPGDGKAPDCGRAWNKHADIDWDDGDGTGVGPGDTLWLIGEIRDGREYVYRDRNLKGMVFSVPVSGLPGKPISIRGDHPIKPGVVIGSHVADLVEFKKQADGTYFMPKVRNYKNIHAVALGDAENDWPVDSICSLAPAQSRAEVAGRPGSFFADEAGLVLNPGQCTGNAVAYRHQGGLNLMGADHIVIDGFKGLFFARDFAPITLASGYGGEVETNTGVAVKNCTIGFASMTPGIEGLHGSKDCLIENNVFVNVRNAIYYVTYKGLSSAENLVIRGNEIYCRKENNYHLPLQNVNDAHAIGAQGICHNCLIEKNHIHDFYGDGILFYYNSKYEYGSNTTIRWNVIEDLDEDRLGMQDDSQAERGEGNAYWNNGIMLFGTNYIMMLSRNKFPGWKIYGNVFRNIDPDSSEKSNGAAMHIKWSRPEKMDDVIKVYGNVIDGAQYGVLLDTFQVDGEWYTSGNVQHNYFKNITKAVIAGRKVMENIDHIRISDNYVQGRNNTELGRPVYVPISKWNAKLGRGRPVLIEDEPTGDNQPGLQYVFPVQDSTQ